MEKIDLKKVHKELYSVRKNLIVFIDVPQLNYLCITGKGNPETSPEYQQKIEALFGLAYPLKFMIKAQGNYDFTVMPLEGFWWAEDMTAFPENRRDEWIWKLLIALPEEISEEDVSCALKQVKQKKENPFLDHIKLETIEEGKCAQVMHIGPFEEEPATIEKLHTHIKESGYELRGKHHEIYLSDIRRTAPQNWKTIIRQGVK